MSPSASTWFANRLLEWFADNGRTDLPWQKDKNAYKVWVSEIMLQQTRVQTVIPYFERFIHRFPTLVCLAEAEQDEVLAHWSGLGYYARGRNLHAAAIICNTRFNGALPCNLNDLVSLPGIGRSTAGAILSIACKTRAPILDGNVKRVLARFLGIGGWPGKKAVENQLWQAAERYTPQTQLAEYTQAIMDLGATVCTRTSPECEHCPFSHSCFAFINNRIADFPGKKPKRTNPTRQAWLLIIRNEKREIWLEKQPDKGIWGGLWSLPQRDIKESRQHIAARVEMNQRVSVKSHSVLDEFTHIFSHFNLKLRPLVLEVKETGYLSEPHPEYGTGLNNGWKSEMVATTLGLPAPIKKVLASIHTVPDNQ
ncbi:MAG: A/G-specific adenine glycosylase [Gammaproteobacteria bacterium]|nr:MAG: A/G-specific adenine glycosylase [Pseudomonadota bacterium]PIE38672.1 MAG: A/G-specific adenine glycosylase [Gammaproteobacteria bacterium]